MSINYGRKALRLVLFPSIFFYFSQLVNLALGFDVYPGYSVYLHMYMQEFAIPNTGRQVGRAQNRGG